MKRVGAGLSKNIVERLMAGPGSVWGSFYWKFYNLLQNTAAVRPRMNASPERVPSVSRDEAEEII
jgi:hypothetical protein